MAADKVVCPFFGVVFERLNSLIYNDQMKKLGPLAGLVKELKKLFKTFLKIKEVLDDAEEKQFNKKAERVRVWLQELNDAAYEADDVFDKFEYEALQQAEGASNNNSNKKKKRQRIRRKIEKLIQIFDEKAEECSGLDLQKGKEKSVIVSPERITMSLLTEPQVYGRDEDTEKLVKQLLGSAYLTLDQFHTPINKHPKGIRGAVQNSASSSNQGSISVFPILGMGGLGKTTLAQLVYNDKRVKSHFEVRSWVCVSDDFDINRFAKAFVASDSGRECNLEDLELLQQHVQKEVHGKRFLLVLDDVWEESRDKWNKIMKIFEGGALGSSIIVTTRLKTVASIASALLPHSLDGLSKRDCWALFKQYAFGPGNEERPALVKIGKQIVKKCGGLPLAAKALGSLLRFKNDESEWLSIKDSTVWDFENAILPALRLSYYHLSFTLKQCFVYCSIFPKDHEIEKQKLIQLWMANGLLQIREDMDLEDVGNATFNKLLWRAFFQDIEKDKDGNIISCKMHDLVHDLASYIAGDEHFVKVVERSRRPTERTRHASVQFVSKVSTSSTLESMQRSSPRLRSLVQFGNNHMTLEPEFVFSNFVLLRALDLNSCEIKVVPDCIGEMKHLRYLNLCHNYDITSLPESICLLRNMQTLSLGRCYSLSSLPEHIENMRCLVHLDIEGCVELTSMPIGIGQLTCLRTLGMFILGKESGSGVDGLQKLNSLRGKLRIDGLDVVETLHEAKEANLTSKKNIHSLRLCWRWEWRYQRRWEWERKREREREREEWLERERERHEERLERERERESGRGRRWDGQKRFWSKPRARAPGSNSNSDSDSDSRQQRQQQLHHSRQQRQQRHQTVIEGLQPHSNVRKLRVEGYRGATLSPSWLTEASLLPNLVKICLFYCTCEHLGSLRKLPRLKILKLSYMDSLKFIEVVDDASAAGGGFPSLEELRLVSMANLEGWSSASSSSQAATTVSAKKLERCPKLQGGGLPFSLSSSSLSQAAIPQQEAVFPCLKSVRFYGCPKLKGVPLSWAPLQHIEIEYCNGMVLGSVRDLPSLPSLLIDKLDDLEYFPSGTLTNLTALHELKIKECRYLKSLPVALNSLATLTKLKISKCRNLVSLAAEEREGGLKNLSSLKTLQIVSCHALKSLPEFGKASLVSLSVSGCPEMEFSKEDFEHLVVLEELVLVGLPKLTCFPEGIKHSAATLRRLQFLPGAPVDLPDWIGTTLTSLEFLSIEAPKNWEVFPQWMQHLTAIEALQIFGCNEEIVNFWLYIDDLKKVEIYGNEDTEGVWDTRYRQREEKYFNMISHVPHVGLYKS